MTLIAIVIGATGQVGRQLVPRLIPTYDKVITVTRRPLDTIPHYLDDTLYKLVPKEQVDKKLHQVILDDITTFDIGSITSTSSDKIHFFCCFGTTRQQAGGGTQFEAMEKKIIGGYIDKCFKNSPSPVVSYYALVSSAGAKANSWLLYPRVKGELENQLVSTTNDKMTSTIRIYRPGFLRCDREQKRWGERLMDWIMPIGRMFGSNKLEIPTEQLAQAMVRDAQDFIEGRNSIKALIRSNADCIQLATSQ